MVWLFAHVLTSRGPGLQMYIMQHCLPLLDLAFCKLVCKHTLQRCPSLLLH